MKTLTRLLLTTLLASLTAAAAATQTQTSTATAQEQTSTAAAQTGEAWVEVAPKGEVFSALMPLNASPQTQHVQSGVLKASGRIYTYTSGDGDTTYSIWSLKNSGYNLKPPVLLTDEGEFSDYMDACAELASDLIVAPVEEKARLGQAGRAYTHYGMIYAGQSPGLYLMREYQLVLDKRHGFVDIYSNGSQIYIVTAHAVGETSANVEKFINSFAVKLAPQPGGALLKRDAARFGTASGVAGGIGSGETGEGFSPGRGSNQGASTGGDLVQRRPGEHMGGGGTGGSPATENYPPDYIFSGREVTRKASVTSKPVPSYTNAARKFTVTGRVSLRVVLGADGRVGSISVIHGLPHGLTQSAINVARQIKFEPAERDGRKVSQWMVIEYNFNIY